MKIELYILDKHRRSATLYKEVEFTETPIVGDLYSDDEKSLKLTNRVLKNGKLAFTCTDITDAFKLIST